MAAFNFLSLTNAGKNLLSKIAVAGTIPLEITRCAVGEGVLVPPADWHELTDLINRTHWMSILNHDVVAPGETLIVCQLTSSDIPVQLSLYEVGIYAIDPDLGEILYAYSYTSTPDVIPPGGGSSAVIQRFELRTIIGDADVVVINVDDSAAATIGQIQALSIGVQQQEVPSSDGLPITLLSAFDPLAPLAVYLDGIRITGFSLAGMVLTISPAPSIGAHILIEQPYIIGKP